MLLNLIIRRGVFASLLVGFASGCGSDDDGESEPGGTDAAMAPVVLLGDFAPLPGYGDRAVTGVAVLERGDAEARVSVQVNGLTAGLTYPAHVHEWPCAQSGGGHYKIDPSVETGEEDNEIWPTVTAGEDGTGRAEVVVPHQARGDALSIVVHDPEADGAKLACADLSLGEDAVVRGAGRFAPLASSEDGDQAIEGSAEYARSAGGFNLQLRVSGLDPAETYRAHVHALPCGVMAGGGHYKIDPSVTDALAENELWPEVVPDAAGSVQTSLASTHPARLDAQSVVIHRVVGDGAPKVACADLVVSEYPERMTRSDPPVLYDAGTAPAYANLAASAVMSRSGEGGAVALSVTGLPQSAQAYPVHVHALPCGVGLAGGHYKLDPSESEALEDKEIWLPLMADAAGAATNQVALSGHVARAEAQSIVIHDPGGAKLACLDLQ